MILTKQQIQERLHYGQISHTDIVDTVDDIEFRLKAATDMGPCGKHPRSFWHDPDGPTNFLLGKMATMGHCTICAEVQAAYERGKRDAADMARTFCINSGCLETGNIVMNISGAILALKDRGAKGGRG